MEKSILPSLCDLQLRKTNMLIYSYIVIFLTDHSLKGFLLFGLLLSSCLYNFWPAVRNFLNVSIIYFFLSVLRHSALFSPGLYNFGCFKVSVQHREWEEQVFLIQSTIVLAKNHLNIDWLNTQKFGFSPLLLLP